jgi:hypothetical protein
MVNGKQSTVMPDTVRALSEVTVNGEIRSDDGVFAANFNGTLYPLFYDKPEQFTTLANDPRSKQDSFFVQKNILFKGNVSVIDGQFSFTFLVPRDISFNFGNGRLSYYAMSTETDASGFYEDFILGGIELNGPADLEGPAIELYLNDRIFQPGDMVNPDASLLAFLADPSGISSQGITIGHDIVATLDGETGFAIVLNDYFELDPDSYQSGQVIYPFVELEEGPHTLTLKAWDLLNNSSSVSIDFIVSDTIGLAIRNLINYPNPFRDYTYFSFEHNQFNETLSVTIDIWALTGAWIKRIGPSDIQAEGYQASSLFWDGKDYQGNTVSRGVYIYHLTLDNKKESSKTLVGKLIVMD